VERSLNKVNAPEYVVRSSISIPLALPGLLLLGSATPPALIASPAPPAVTSKGAALSVPTGAFVDTAPRAGIARSAAILEDMPPPVPTAEQALEEGVLIVVSLKSQQMFVFREGEAWASSKVSTGKKGHATPTGEFPILQKRVHHRSNLYSNAPMPYMQRLTWDGVALHAGHVPGYPASHGCIRLPTAFAQSLYQITDFTKTVVVVTDKPIASADAARGVV
jgi:lipoprotein-anchoring transpeptidase ErfK/SrfK